MERIFLLFVILCFLSTSNTNSQNILNPSRKNRREVTTSKTIERPTPSSRNTISIAEDIKRQKARKNNQQPELERVELKLAKPSESESTQDTTITVETKKNLFSNSKKTSQQGGSEDKAGGYPNSNCNYGVPGKGGMGWSLKGRTAKTLPEPSHNSNQQGKVIVKIWVNRDGVVTRAEATANSTITDAALKRQAEQAALKAKFSPDPNATELQTGTITYFFRKTD